MHYFTFIPRHLDLTFFDSNPIKISLPMGDAMDALLTEMAQSIDSAPDLPAAESALYPVLGKDAADAILARAEPRDALAVQQLAAYVLRQYADGKAKNLSAAQSGRRTETGS